MLRSLLASTRHTYRSHGLKQTLKVTRGYIGAALFPVEPDETARRYRLGQKLSKLFNNTVAYGPFSGLALSDTSWWGAADRGSMLLGLYEQEVLSSLAELSEGRNTFVDVGATDGYYAVGAITSKLFSQAFCHEISAEGQHAIQHNAQRNGVADRVHVFGEASASLVEELQQQFDFNFSETVFLIDIEGAEFSLLTEHFLAQVHESALIIEIHDWQAKPSRGVDELVADAEKHFHVTWLTMGSRDPSVFPEFDLWPDDDRWILCSESRQKLMRWMVLTPRTTG